MGMQCTDDAMHDLLECMLFKCTIYWNACFLNARFAIADWFNISIYSIWQREIGFCEWYCLQNYCINIMRYAYKSPFLSFTSINKHTVCHDETPCEQQSTLFNEYARQLINLRFEWDCNAHDCFFLIKQLRLLCSNCVKNIVYFSSLHCL